MKIIKIQAANDKIIEEVINNLKKGKVIVYPTETFYGLGCDATNSRAVNKIYKIKSKPRDKALLFLVSSVKMAQEYLEINSAAKKLGKPIISTSANLSGLPASHTVEEIIKYFTNQKHQPDLILDAGKLKKSKGSTIVDLTELEIKIIREGDVKIKL
ncbi:MAG: Sua5/YciO/YrdC/YwlC family protein [Candidatus Falkowbacteria bacterium GW2011_GWF2_39_8]|uniref:L-threonylcarbamoyladenylate synthase n=1 Tax=Candidatus Falkowbacteria bacterium GW2011_GWF2_39_8 TaxID=1618642 RepID=A0A0G0T4Z9_9BACT|nr:MAG: Sua5/YciO/YrdC/YwlC family protein [Candidatus Falkowbacteria bacterium GW2011_GWF2_39_8]